MLFTYFLLALFTLILAKDKCGQHKCADKALNQSYHFYLKGCFCDSRCEVYDDCCINYNTTDISTSDKYGESKCVTADSEHSLMMVTSCNKKYSHESEISQNCNMDSGHPAWDVPVTSIKSKIVYKNMFCALCNGEKNYTFWNIRIECPEKIDPRKLSKTFNENMEGCRTKKENLDPSYEHKCNNSIISTCPQGTKDEETVENCRNGYYGVIYDLNGTMYKNIFCFNCNVNKSEEILCNYDSGTTMIEFEARLSFAVLLNFNRDVTTNEADHLVKMNPCKEGYIYTNGECRKKLHVGKNSSKCTQVKLNNDEFVLLANGTLYHNATKTFHGQGYYSINGTSHMDVYICLDRISNKNKQRIPLATKTEIQLTYVCSVISMIALAILIIKFLYFLNIRTLSGFIYVSFAITLFIAQLLFVLTPHFSNMGISSCRAVAVAMHYAFLSSFFWLNSITVNIWLSVCWTPCQSKKYSEKRSFISYSAFSWLTPILFIVPAILLDKYKPNSVFAPSYGLYEFCWINKGWSIMLFFAGPLALILLVNFIIYIHTAITIYKLRKFTQQHSDRNDVVAVFINMKLCLLTGITWSIGYVAIVTHSYHLTLAFIFLNSSFGLWVAISFLFSRNICTKMKQKIRTLTETGE